VGADSGRSATVFRSRQCSRLLPHSSPSRHSQSGWNGWGVMPDHRRFQNQRNAELRVSDVARLQLAWAFAFDGETMAYGQPAVGQAAYAAHHHDARSACGVRGGNASRATPRARVGEAADGRPCGRGADACRACGGKSRAADRCRAGAACHAREGAVDVASIERAVAAASDNPGSRRHHGDCT